MKTKLIPLNDGLICEAVMADNKSAAGILLGTDKRQVSWRVIAAGSQVSEVKKGDLILIEQGSGTEFKLDGKDYIKISEFDVLAKVVI